MSLLTVDKLTKSFGGLRAIDMLDWKVESGKIIGLIGPNGAGKSTLFNMINGSIRPDSGDIKWNEESFVGLRPDQIAQRGIGRVFQHTLLFRGKTVFQNLLVPCYRDLTTGFWQALFNTASYQREEEIIRQRAQQIMEFIGLSQWRDNLAETLPFGMQRMLSIGQALMTKPQLLLLDEPLTGLNEEEVTELSEKIREIHGQGITIILIEHHMRGVMLLCDRIMVLNQGRKIADGTSEQIVNDATVIDCYLGSEKSVT